MTGTLAGAYIRGVQGEGIATALKHFVSRMATLPKIFALTGYDDQLGNEQETQRNSSNSVISSRVLRELYLEPFRIAIRDADPRCIM